jgi:hypothetical protein
MEPNTAALDASSAPAFVTRREGCDLLGIKLRTWSEWERTGRLPRGRFVPNPGKPGRQLVYPLDQLVRLRDELATRYEPYPDPDRRGCYRLPIASDKYPGEAIIDAESLPIVQGRRWNWAPGHRPGDGAVIPSMGGSPKTPLRQLIMGVSGREHPVSHLNGDPRDLRRANLIVRTPSQVSAARAKVACKAGRAVSSAYKGVSWITAERKWGAAITAEGKHHFLGLFKTELAAAVAYDTAARKLFGPHASCNFRQGPDPEAYRQAMETESYEPPFPPPGHVTRREACRMFGVSCGAWLEWERKGRVTCGHFVPNPKDKPGRSKVYPLDELHRLLDEFSRIGKPYADRDRPGVWRVPIRSLIHRMEALIDAEDLPIVDGRHWNWQPRGRGGDGAVVLATRASQHTPLARLITSARGVNDRVMHLNDDPLDCRRCNLIVRTPAEQTYTNSKITRRNGKPLTSIYKGVSWDERRGCWRANIIKDRHMRHLGNFDAETDAAEAYDRAARVLFGEHARLNFPDGVDARPEAEGYMPTVRAAAAA